MPSVAKFWFTHRLGRLTTYPSQCGCNQAYQLIQKPRTGTQWMPYRNNLAFFLPVTSSLKTQTTLRTYGGLVAAQVYRGGGPFVLTDSFDMVARALSKMCYLDTDFNSDVAEAMMVFVNTPENKLALRKLCGALPSADDTSAEVEPMLRQAFLSHATSGQWRLAPKDVAVRKELCKTGFFWHL